MNSWKRAAAGVLIVAAASVMPTVTESASAATYLPGHLPSLHELLPGEKETPMKGPIIEPPVLRH